MTTPTPAPSLDAALEGLSRTLDEPGADGWAWSVRQRMVAVRAALDGEPDGVPDAWLAARAGCLMRARTHLRTRVRRLGRAVVEPAAGGRSEDLRTELRRLLVDLEHHRQRCRDLVWDSVELELGGSE